MTQKIWACKIGAIDGMVLPSGSDLPMRMAIKKAYFDLTGEYPEFLFSGWGAKLTPGELECVLEHRKFGDGDYEEEFLPSHDEEE